MNKKRVNRIMAKRNMSKAFRTRLASTVISFKLFIEAHLFLLFFFMGQSFSPSLVRYVLSLYKSSLPPSFPPSLP